MHTKENVEHAVVKEISAMAVVFCNGKILYTREDIYGKEVISLPKGHVEDGETIVQAAIRECFEETNVVVTSAQVVCALDAFVVKFIDHHGNNVEKTICPILFVCGSEVNPLATEKRVSEVGYAVPDEFLQRCAYENVKNIVAQALHILEERV